MLKSLSRQDKTIFIFFNDARRVLPAGFDGDSVLVLRSGKTEPSVVRRGRLPAITRSFAPQRLKAIIDLRVNEAEAQIRTDVHAAWRITFLDLAAYFSERYPAGKIASSGYAMAVWLHESFPEKAITLRGFNALRSQSWKVFDIHDWIFEQCALRLMAASGSLRVEGTTPAQPTAMAALQAQFPRSGLPELLSVQAAVLSDRLEHANGFIDQLWSATKFSRFLRRCLRWRRSAR